MKLSFDSSNTPRLLTIDGRIAKVLHFNEPNTPISVDGATFQIRLGVPKRELYINDWHYRCNFDNAENIIRMHGIDRIVKIEGPLPKLSIVSDTDLALGMVKFFVDKIILERVAGLTVSKVMVRKIQ